MINIKFTAHIIGESTDTPVSKIEFSPEGSIKKVTLWVAEDGKWIQRVYRGDEANLKIEVITRA